MAGETARVLVGLRPPAQFFHHFDGARLAQHLVRATVLVAIGPGGVFATFATNWTVGVVTAGGGTGANALDAERGICGEDAEVYRWNVGGSAADTQARGDGQDENR